MNNNSDFIKGIGIGIVAGVSAGMVISPRKNKQNMIGKALRVAGELAENISSAMTR